MPGERFEKWLPDVATLKDQDNSGRFGPAVYQLEEQLVKPSHLFECARGIQQSRDGFGSMHAWAHRGPAQSGSCRQ